MTKDHYKKALNAARDELAELEDQRAKIDRRISELQQGIVGLSALAAEDTGEKPETMMDVLAGVGVETGLTDAVRMITSSFGFPMTPKQVRDALMFMDYDLSGYSNILASLHTIMKRLAKAGDLLPVTDDAGKEIGGYVWNPAVSVRRAKTVTASAGINIEALRATSRRMGDPEPLPKLKLNPLGKRVAARLQKKNPAWFEHLKRSGGLVIANPPYLADGTPLTRKQLREATEIIEEEKRREND